MQITQEVFNLTLNVSDIQEKPITIPSDLTITHSDALCKMWYRPAILRIFQKDIGLDVNALRNLDATPSAAALIHAIDLIQDYLNNDNPAFFIYRFGIKEGTAMETGLKELKALASWVSEQNYILTLKPTRRYHIAGRLDEIIENTPGEAHTW